MTTGATSITSSNTKTLAKPTAAQHSVVDAKKGPAQSRVEEAREAAPKVDHFDVKKAGAPSPDFSGMAPDDGDDDAELDPVDQVPTIPARAMQSKVRA